MRKEQLLKIILKYPVEYVGETPCWTPKVCKLFTGVKSINTVYNWVKKDKNGEWNSKTRKSASARVALNGARNMANNTL